MNIPRVSFGLLFFGLLASAQTTPVFRVLHTFLGSPTDGLGSNAPVVLDSSGNIFGTTISGGPSTCRNSNLPYGCGIVYELSPPASGTGPYTETILHGFQGGADGANTQGAVIFGPGGALYGTTLFGGSSPTGFGTIFALAPNGSGFDYYTLIRFSDAPGTLNVPENQFTYWQGNLYTTAQDGGAYGNYGGVLELVEPTMKGGAWSYNALYSLDGADGNQIQGAVIVDPSTGYFYTCAQNGGAADEGTIFQLLPPAVSGGAWTLNLLYQFTAGDDGGYIYAGPVLGAHGVLYGIAQTFGEYGKGTIWSLTPPASGTGPWTFAVIHQFGSVAGDGATPVSNLVLDSSGVLYGTTLLGGANDLGTVFTLTPPANVGGLWTEKILWSFSQSEGTHPYSTVTLVKPHVLIGTTPTGGTANAGTVYELTF
jgi:uncharacterized repeat protein (TIGR03803 family)